MNIEKLTKTLDFTIGLNQTNKSDNENANIDSNTPMGTMLRVGGETSKEYYLSKVIPQDISVLHKKGYIHIHDLDFYSKTTTCCQIDVDKIFETGFNTGHGYIRTPQDIKTYAALACIILQSNQNDQHGGQAIPNFDYAMAKGVRKTFNKHVSSIRADMEKLGLGNAVSTQQIEDMAWEKTDKDTFQAMESLVHNLNTMAGRAGAQVPFTSINYGTDTSIEGRMVIKNILLATQKGLGKSETPIFPIQIFRMKSGINLNPGEPNEDLFELACKVSSKRLFPNFSFQDAPFNIQYFDASKPETFISYMGCRSRVIGNTYDPSNQITHGRGNLSFTSINLPRLAIENQGINEFYFQLDLVMEKVYRQLLHRFEIQRKKIVKNYPFLMGQGVWIGSDKLKSKNDSVGEILKHGTLAFGFVGLAECLKALTGKHHGEDRYAQELGLEIITRMRDFAAKKSEQDKLNFSLIATPAESLAGRFVNIDRDEFGAIDGVTDREYYTNSFHVPVYHEISIKEKIDIEAPYHELTPGGHITYIELKSCTEHNAKAMKDIVKYMAKSGTGYCAINHPTDFDPECGFTGVIGDCCPNCGRKETEDSPFSRLRRITGYLTSTLSKWNSAKQAEEKDRVKHDTNCRYN